MKRIVCLIVVSAALGGCVVLPAGPAYRADYGYVQPRVVVTPTWSVPYRSYGGYGDGGWHAHGGYGRGSRGW